MKGGDPLSVPTPCQSNTKVTPGGGDGAEGKIRAEWGKSQKEKD